MTQSVQAEVSEEPDISNSGSLRALQVIRGRYRDCGAGEAAEGSAEAARHDICK